MLNGTHAVRMQVARSSLRSLTPNSPCHAFYYRYRGSGDKTSDQPPLDNSLETSNKQPDLCIEEYNTALRNLAYNNSADEPGTISTVLRLVVYDGMVSFQSEDLTIQIQPINDNLPEITIPSREVPFVEENPVSPSVPVAVGAMITDRDIPRTPITSLIVEILNPLNSIKERVHIMGSLSPDVTFNSSNPHRLVIQAVNAPLQLQRLQDALGIVYYENTAEEPIGPNRTILISATDDLYQSGVQQSSPERITLMFSTYG